MKRKNDTNVLIEFGSNIFLQCIEKHRRLLLSLTLTTGITTQQLTNAFRKRDQIHFGHYR